MQYQAVYDIQQVIYPAWWLTAVGIVIISIGALIFSAKRRSSDLTEKLLPIGFMFFGLLWLAGGAFNYFEVLKVRAAVKAGNYEVVEGIVRDFVPMPYSGGGKESFSVNGRWFSYSDFHLGIGFNQSKSHGGPIREGLKVKVSFIGESIVKLEIAQ
jgi:hypothetical protein